MIGVDSNVLLRYVLGDDPLWTKAAEKFFEKTCSPDNPAYINSIVLVEAVWVLRRIPGYGKETIVTFVRGLLDSDRIVIGSREIVELALNNFEKGSAGFADCFISALNTEAGATPTYSIDKNAIKNGIFVAIK